MSNAMHVVKIQINRENGDNDGIYGSSINENFARFNTKGGGGGASAGDRNVFQVTINTAKRPPPPVPVIDKFRPKFPSKDCNNKEGDGESFRGIRYGTDEECAPKTNNDGSHGDNVIPVGVDDDRWKSPIERDDVESVSAAAAAPNYATKSGHVQNCWTPNRRSGMNDGVADADVAVGNGSLPSGKISFGDDVDGGEMYDGARENEVAFKRKRENVNHPNVSAATGAAAEHVGGGGGRSRQEWKKEETIPTDARDLDKYLTFHLHEMNFESGNGDDVAQIAPYRGGDPKLTAIDRYDGLNFGEAGKMKTCAIRSERGTIRGVKNRVKAGIATFMRSNAVIKDWQMKEAGKVVVYTTTMGIIRETYQRCLKVRQILRTHLVKFEEKDVFMSKEFQNEIVTRMRDYLQSEPAATDSLRGTKNGNGQLTSLPQIFIAGVYIGDADAVERLNESGELRKLLQPYKRKDACLTCQVCGGYRLLPCNACNGSKKSFLGERIFDGNGVVVVTKDDNNNTNHRYHRANVGIAGNGAGAFSLISLKCVKCDEVGLMKCYACRD